MRHPLAPSLQRLWLLGSIAAWTLLAFFVEPEPLLHYGLPMLSCAVALAAWNRPWHRFNLVYGFSVMASTLLQWHEEGAQLVFLLPLGALGGWLLLDHFEMDPRPQSLHLAAYLMVFLIGLLLLSHLPFGASLQGLLLALVVTSLLSLPAQEPLTTWPEARLCAIFVLLTSLLLAGSLYLSS